MHQSSVVQVFFNVAQYLASVGLFDQTAIRALTHCGPQLQAVNRCKEDRLSASACAVTQCCRSMVIGHVKRYQTGSVKVRFQRRNRERTSDAPGMGFGEMLLSRALKAAADLPGFPWKAGTSLIQGAKSPIVSNP